MRKLKRNIARARMRAEGIRHMNKTRIVRNPVTGRTQTLPSYFAENWRNYINK